MAKNKSKFLKRFHDGHRNRITEKVNGWLFAQYEKLAELTAKIDYSCNFDKLGRCRIDVEKTSEVSDMGCCKYCSDNLGYLMSIHESHISILSKNFNTETGFWRKKKGCILPRKYRSPLCLDYICKNNIIPRDYLLLKSIYYGPMKSEYFIFNNVIKTETQHISNLICDFLCRIYNDDEIGFLQPKDKNKLKYEKELYGYGIKYLKAIRPSFVPNQRQYVKNLIEFHEK